MSLGLHRTIREFRRACDEVRRTGRRLALVPTMGALHEGHLELVRAAQKEADEVAVTIFVNPTQFGPAEDFERYPRDLRSDLDKCRLAKVSHVFAPAVNQMYPAGEQTRVRVTGLTEGLCGASRPGHFDGVATVVAKLFAIAGPCVAIFGKKDYQQLQVIRRLTTDLMLPVRVVGHPIVRERDGLALSSRNRYLSAEERERALAIPQALARAVAAHAGGESSVARLRADVQAHIQASGLRLDYATIAHADNLEPLEDGASTAGRALLAVAAFAGTTRLIDNVVLGEDPPPLGGAEA